MMGEQLITENEENGSNRNENGWQTAKIKLAAMKACLTICNQ